MYRFDQFDGSKLSSIQFLVCILIFLITIQSGLCDNSKNFWNKPGCHKVGHIRKVRIPSCIEFEVRTNACRGFCPSYSIPSSKEAMRINPKQILTSVSQCCTIVETEDVTARIMCEGGLQDFTFKSAKTCSCFQCKKE